MAPDYTVVRVSEEPTFVGGKPAADLRYEIKVGDDGPFFERFDKATATEFTIQQRLSEFARMIQATRR